MDVDRPRPAARHDAGVEPMNPADLSGGMRKRVGLARTIALQPEVLLYDEPTTGLDPINITRIKNLIPVCHLHSFDELNAQGITLVVVTHDMTTASTVSDRLAMVHKGRVIASGTFDQFRHSQNPIVHDFIHGNAPDDEDMLALANASS